MEFIGLRVRRRVRFSGNLARKASVLGELQIEDLHFDGAPAVEVVDDGLESDAAAAVLLEVLDDRAQAEAYRL